ncbi:MAG: DUF6165 family protein [Polyangiaceae bacterium]
MSVTIEISPGEAIDRVSILELKLRHLPAGVHVELRKELDQLREQLSRTRGAFPGLSALEERLREVNATLWQAEEQLREHERRQEFDSQFIDCARAVYVNNDLRCAIKHAIDGLFGVSKTERKSFSLPTV